MRSSMSWEDLWPLLLDGTLDTLYMVGLAALWCITLLFRERDGEE